jgi:hypothetical protein
MKSSFSRLIFFTCFAVLIGIKAFAFSRSEDELMRAEVQEAKARARDFQAQQERAAKADREREVAAGEIKAERNKFEEMQEQARIRFVEIRNSKPDPQLEEERLEKQFEAQKALEDEKTEQNRASYLRKRAAVQKTIETEAYIDPNAEYGLK